MFAILLELVSFLSNIFYTVRNLFQGGECELFRTVHFHTWIFTLFLCPPVTARRPGCRPGPGTTKRLSACGTSAVSFWESSRSRPGGRRTVVSGRVHTMRNGDQGEGLPCRLVLAGCCSEPWPAVILPALLEIFAHPTLS